ncbi:MAG: hypothetical protein ACI808_002625 [Paraglaciecola sp.]|jgi:hypothetical protein
MPALKQGINVNFLWWLVAKIARPYTAKVLAEHQLFTQFKLISKANLGRSP